MGRSAKLQRELRRVLRQSAFVLTHPILALGNRLGDHRQWDRIAMYEAADKLVAARRPETLDVLEISPGPHWPTRFKFKSFESTDYPAFDICKDRLPRTFDLIIADQVFEHIDDPDSAAQNVRAMLNPGGAFLVLTPFLVKYHPMPSDNWRWTPTGLKLFLIKNGYPKDGIVTDSWGNRAFLRAQAAQPDKWMVRGWGSLKNEPTFAVAVWAMAEKG